MPVVPVCPVGAGLKRPSSTECGDARDGVAEDQGVHLFRAFVGPYALQVAHVAHRGIVERDAVTAEDGAGFARYLNGFPYVVEFAEAYLVGSERACVLHPANVKREERTLSDLNQHVRQLLLDELEGSNRPSELLPLFRVSKCGLVTVPRCTQRAPDDAVSSLAKAGEWSAKAFRFGQHRIHGE